MPLDPDARTLELTVVVPSFNERDNIEPLLERLDAALGGIAWEVIYVDDDSPDGTAASDPRARPERSRDPLRPSYRAARAFDRGDRGDAGLERALHRRHRRRSAA